jgi:hypothetical protein
MKRAALYLRVSTVDQHPETQLHDLRGLAAQIMKLLADIIRTNLAKTKPDRSL